MAHETMQLLHCQTLGSTTISGVSTRPPSRTCLGGTVTSLTNRIHCMAVTAQFTVYQVDGKPVFTQRLCSGQTLDDKSRAALDAAIAQAEAEVAKAP